MSHIINFDLEQLHFDEHLGHLFEVTYIGMVEVCFDRTPTENELFEALADNLAYRIKDSLHYGYLDHERNMQAEHIDEVPL